ncbi:MAG: aquaporin, partial [Sulfitobacter sp.]|nr:aquaporin [Sulfitobacter sp.]
MRKYVAEAFGTFVLVFFGVGSAVLAGSGDAVSITGISLAFGISVVAMAYSIGQISGAHLNPAVSMGALVAGRITTTDFIGYALFQTMGAIIAAGAIYVIATSSVGGYDAAAGMGQNGYGAGYGGEFNMV